MNDSLYKGILQPLVIELLRQNGRMYGFEITQKVKALTEGTLKITEGALYPLLHKLEGAGLLESKQEYVDNRYRKYYSLTSGGKKKSMESMAEIETFVSNLRILFKLKLT